MIWPIMPHNYEARTGKYYDEWRRGIFIIAAMTVKEITSTIRSDILTIPSTGKRIEHVVSEPMEDPKESKE